MVEHPKFLVPLLWGAWLLYWLASAPSSKASRRVESWSGQAAHWIPMALTVALLAPPSLPLGPLSERFVPAGPVPFWSGIALLCAGLAFMVWARVHLGTNWSATVTIKREHALVRDGPYRFVRHPIYTGALIALAGTAVVRGEWRGLLAVALMVFFLWRKLRIEERWLGEAFGADYERYRSEVRALIPFVL